MTHLGAELPKTTNRIVVDTKYGKVRGARALNGAAVFLEIPYALPPGRFEDPRPLPADFRYPLDKEYIYESSYAVQPNNDGQAAGIPFESKVGLGNPTENPLFVNIVCPPSFPSIVKAPVQVFIHGGFLQFGSPHGIRCQAQYVSAARSEVRINVGYRLSAFGFLACDEPKILGNFGFKDMWLALEWIHDCISAFGGDPDNIQITGLSAGAHSVHQLLHYASRLPAGSWAPFRSAILYSNAIVMNPKTPKELRPQFRALCHALNLDSADPHILSIIKDENKVPRSEITRVIETGAIGKQFETFRGCLDGVWMPSSPDPMTWQRTGGLAKGLWDKGVRSVVAGYLKDEWYLYSIAHPIISPNDILPNLARYYPHDVLQRMLPFYKTLQDDAPAEEAERLFGEILSDGQVHLPVRLLIRDLRNAGFPSLRYEIRWTPEQLRPKGYVTHATDCALWSLRLPSLTPSQASVAIAWLDAIAAEVKILEDDTKQMQPGRLKDVLTLKDDQTIGWTTDNRWEEMMRLVMALPGENQPAML